MNASTRPDRTRAADPILGGPGSRIACIAWFALVAAAGELLARLINLELLHRVVSYGLKTVWMTPLTDLVLFTGPALLLLAIGRLVPAARDARLFIGMLGTLLFLSLTLQVPGLHWMAQLLLAVGLATAATRLALARPGVLERLVHATLPGLALLTVAALVGVPARYAIMERRELSLLPAPRAGAPNVLFLIFDTVRASSLSLYGARHRTTPRLDRLAARGVTFDRATAPASYTLASHASFFTGRWPRELGVDWTTPLDGRFMVLAEALERAGYRTAGFSGNRPYVSRPYGLARGFAHFSGYPTSAGEALRNSALGRALAGSALARRLGWFEDLLGRKRARDSNAEILAWLSAPSAHPYFVFANYFDAHAPYLPPAPCDTAFGWYTARTSREERFRLRREARAEAETLGPVAARRREPAYEGAIACLDADVGDLLDSLESRHLLDHTLVIVASDHGEEFGEHGVFDHGNSLYLPSLHVPLVLVEPGVVPPGRRINTVVSLRDIPATILDLVGARDTLPGRSLRGLWGDSAQAEATRHGPVLAEIPHAANLPPSYPVSRGDMRSLVTDDYQYIRDGAGREEVFDLRRSPLGNAPATEPGLAARLRALIPPGHD